MIGQGKNWVRDSKKKLKSIVVGRACNPQTAAAPVVTTIEENQKDLTGLLLGLNLFQEGKRKMGCKNRFKN